MLIFFLFDLKYVVISCLKVNGIMSKRNKEKFFILYDVLCREFGFLI